MDGKDRDKVPHPPLGWGEDEVTKFLDHGRCNAFAAFHHWPSLVRLISATNHCFASLLGPRDPSSQLLPGIFAMRTHSAFLGATACALSGQTLDTYLGLRACLESAMYGVYVTGHPELEELWLRRHESAEYRVKVRREFTVQRIIERIRQIDSQIGQMVDEHYQMTIDLGAHPNQLGVWRSMEFSSDEELDYFKLLYLSGGTDVHRDALIHSCNVGFISLGLLRIVLPGRFSTSQTKELIDEMRRQRQALGLNRQSEVKSESRNA